MKFNAWEPCEMHIAVCALAACSQPQVANQRGPYSGLHYVNTVITNVLHTCVLQKCPTVTQWWCFYLLVCTNQLYRHSGQLRRLLESVTCVFLQKNKKNTKIDVALLRTSDWIIYWNDFNMVIHDVPWCAVDSSHIGALRQLKAVWNGVKNCFCSSVSQACIG